MFALVIGEDAEGGCEPKQLVPRQAELPSTGMAIAYVIVDGKGLVQ
jgi:hypothetical protein